MVANDTSLPLDYMLNEAKWGDAMSTYRSDFEAGDILELFGETYQVLENDGTRGQLIPFPSEEVPPREVVWAEAEGEYTRIGSAELPGLTPCATSGGECPTNGRGSPIEIAVKVQPRRS